LIAGWRKLVTLAAEAGKVFAIVSASFAIAAIGVKTVVWATTRASAADVLKISSRQDVSDTKQENETEWRRWMVTQVERISRRVGATVSPPPVISTPPDGGKVTQ
jgi:hypothetical protein